MTKTTQSGVIVEMAGDEMAAVIWNEIKNTLVLPFVSIEIETYDLSLPNRDRTDDEVTNAAASALALNGVAVKCPTITPDAARVRSHNLKKAWKSCNGTLRNLVGGDIFREPILIPGLPKLVKGWDQPIVIGRHGFGDVYRATELDISEPGELILSFRGASGSLRELKVFDFPGPGVALAIYNLDSSIREFARACFNLAIERHLPLLLSTKDTVVKTYDARFRTIFESVFEDEFRTPFEHQGLTFRHKLIDEMVAYAMKSNGGFVWACKNYDGDVQSDFVAQGFGSLGIMTSCMVSSDGSIRMFEAAHGTVTRHYRDYLKGMSPSTNPLSLIFAWSRAIRHRSRLDQNPEQHRFADALENAAIGAVQSGHMTRDLADLCGPDQQSVTTSELLVQIEKRLRRDPNLWAPTGSEGRSAASTETHRLL